MLVKKKSNKTSRRRLQFNIQVKVSRPRRSYKEAVREQFTASLASNSISRRENQSSLPSAETSTRQHDRNRKTDTVLATVNESAFPTTTGMERSSGSSYRPTPIGSVTPQPRQRRSILRHESVGFDSGTPFCLPTRQSGDPRERFDPSEAHVFQGILPSSSTSSATGLQRRTSTEAVGSGGTGPDQDIGISCLPGNSYGA